MVLDNCQYRGVLLTWTIVGQGPAVLSVRAGGVVCFFVVFFSRLSFRILFLPLSGRRPDTDGNDVSKGPLTPNNQPTTTALSKINIKASILVLLIAMATNLISLRESAMAYSSSKTTQWGFGAKMTSY